MKIKIKKRYGKNIEKDEVLPKIKGKSVLAVILCKNKGMIWKAVNLKQPRFTYGKNTYFIEESGMYLSNNKILCSFYVEGISVPMHHSYFKTKYETRKFVDPFSPNGEEKTTVIPVMAGVDIPSEVVHMVLDRHLADEFTKITLDRKSIVFIILLIAIFFLSLGGIAVNYV